MKHVIEATYRTAAGETGTMRIETDHEFGSSSVFSVGQVMGWLMAGTKPDHVRTFTVPVAGVSEETDLVL